MCKYSFQFKLEIAEDYFSGEIESYKAIAKI